MYSYYSFLETYFMFTKYLFYESQAKKHLAVAIIVMDSQFPLSFRK